jgi:hypothetical protein
LNLWSLSLLFSSEVYAEFMMGKNHEIDQNRSGNSVPSAWKPEAMRSHLNAVLTEKGGEAALS